MFLAVEGGTDAVTIGLGVIAGALFFGEFAFFKWIHGPAIDRADRQLQAAEERHKDAMAVADLRLVKLEDKIDRQNLVLEDKALPALIAATTTVSQFQSLMAELREEQERLTRERELEEVRQKALERRASGL